VAFNAVDLNGVRYDSYTELYPLLYQWAHLLADFNVGSKGAFITNWLAISDGFNLFHGGVSFYLGWLDLALRAASI
jgi:hypothetical protein